MPTYEVQTDQGTFHLESDRPVTSDAVMQALVAQMPQGDTAPAPAAPPPPLSMRDLVHAEAVNQGVDPNLALSVAHAESAFNPAARSSTGALGVMQLMPQTAQMLGVDPSDPAQNIHGGVKYLKGLLDKYNGSAPLALAAYNAGPGNVAKYGGVPPFPETQHYVQTVLGGMPGAQTPPQVPGPSLAARLLGPPSMGELGGMMPGAQGPVTDAMAKVPIPMLAGALLPPGMSLPAEIAANAGISAFAQADRLVHQKMAVNGDTSLTGAIHAIGDLGHDDLMSIGKWAVFGGTLAGALRGTSRAMCAPPTAARAAASDALGGNAPPTLAMTGGPNPDLATFAQGAAERLPQPDVPATNAAYAAARDAQGAATGSTTVDPGPFQQTLATAAASLRRAGYAVPASFNPDTVGDTLDSLLERISVIRRLGAAKALGTEPTIDAATLERTTDALSGAIRQVMDPTAVPLLDAAEAARLAQGQASRLQDLVQQTGTVFDKDGSLVPNGTAMLGRLLKKDDQWGQKLGDLYQPAVDFARNVATLQKSPAGRSVFQTIAGAVGGAAVGAGAAVALGNSPMRGAEYGAVVGAGGPHLPGIGRLFSPTMAPIIERLSGLRPSSDAFFAEAGRAVMAARAVGADPQQATP